jgi:hypothetical protein
MTACLSTCRRPSPAQAHCPTCHRTFGGVTGFDHHRKFGECVEPKGYIETDGIWRLPMTAERSAQLDRLRGDS